jgi:hypothetical protein
MGGIFDTKIIMEKRIISAEKYEKKQRENFKIKMEGK